MFLQAPRQGVKARLAAEIGDRHALRLYRLLAARVLDAARESKLTTTIWFTPAEAVAEMRFWLGDAFVLRPQASGDFGARLLAASRAVEPGSAWLAVGPDVPALTAGLLREAATALERVDAVLGPTLRGGYYLIGGRTPLAELFTAMPWRTNQVLAETRARLARAGTQWHELPALRDVETAEDARAEGLLD